MADLKELAAQIDVLTAKVEGLEKLLPEIQKVDVTEQLEPVAAEIEALKTRIEEVASTAPGESSGTSVGKVKNEKVVPEEAVTIGKKKYKFQSASIYMKLEALGGVPQKVATKSLLNNKEALSELLEKHPHLLTEVKK